MPRPLRFATFNTALSRQRFGELRHALSVSYRDRQARYVAGVIQRVRPDVLVLQEFDYDPLGLSLSYFQRHYLQHPQYRASPVVYPYAYQVPSNTGMLAEVALRDVQPMALPQDAYGFGHFAGQYAFALLSRYPLDFTQYRTFQQFLWTDLPQAHFPIDPETNKTFYPVHVQSLLRLVSKNLLDIVVKTPLGDIHVIAAHPTPPAFDGEEKRNQWRNFDENRLLVEYLNNAAYLCDDQGQRGGLATQARFVLMGDFNADPTLGNSIPGAIQQLLDHARLHPTTTCGHLVPRNNLPEPQQTHTYFSGKLTLRLDYVLPSCNFTVVKSGIFAPTVDQEGYELVRYNNSSDHRLVWVDVC